MHSLTLILAPAVAIQAAKIPANAYNARERKTSADSITNRDTYVKSPTSERAEPVMPPTSGAATDETSNGTFYGFLAYSMWGLLPIYFHSLDPASAIEILVHRIVWSLIFCLALGTIIGDRSWIWTFRYPRRLALLSVAACVLTVNWGVYIYAVTTDNVIESSLGYFINPLILVLMGVVLLKERLRTLQWIAVGIAGIAVIIISFDYGRLPWIALSLAFSFATYGFIKKQVGANIDALPSMTIETAVLAPVALIAIVWIEVSGSGTFLSAGGGHTAMLLSTGVVTAVPLILFAAAARRVPLATMGLLQFLAPVLQFITAVAILGEVVPASRWIGFILVWVALVILATDIVRHSQARRRARLKTANSLA